MTSKALQVLNLKPGTRTDEEIKKQYRKLARKYHPDRVKDPEKRSEYENKFKEISDAYQFLTTETKSETNKPPIIQTVLSVTLEELYQGVTKSVVVSCQTVCHKCPDHQNCNTCHGQGCLVTWNGIACICGKCGGTGRLISNCKYCGGSKVYMTNKELEVNIKHEQNITVKGQGHETPVSSIAGDIHILLDLYPHSDYEILENDDLQLNITLDLKLALLGGKLDFTHLDNNEYSVDIPECTKLGQVLRISELGLSDKDLLVNISNINFPKKLTKENRELLSQIEFN